MASKPVIKVSGLYQKLPLPLYFDGIEGDSVRRIKERIQALTDIDASNQLIFLNRAGHCSFLPEEAVVEANYSRPSMILDLALFPKIKTTGGKVNFAVLVENDSPAYRAGDELAIRITPDSTVTRLRQIIDEKTGVPPTRQTINFLLNNGFTFPVEPDELGEMALSEILPDGIRRAVLKSVAPNPANLVVIQVVVGGGNGVIELRIDPANHTVNSIKREVLAKIETDPKLRKILNNKKEFVLKVDGRGSLSDGTLTLVEHGVDAGQKLFLV